MAGRMSKEDANREFPCYFKLLSEKLYQVLENFWVTPVVRDAEIKRITMDEILHSVILCANEKLGFRALYLCGSAYEGTKTLGLHSDVDNLFVSGHLYVVTSITEAQQYQKCCLLIQDSYTPPGYAKLQFVVQGIPIHRSLCTHLSHDTDLEGRAVFTLNGVTTRPNSVWHGPAQTAEVSPFGMTYDSVEAFRCHTWPVCASEWLTRERDYNWPTQEQLDECKTLGFFVVYVGHPTSVEKRLQWRLSFTLQERMLVTYFNSVQLKCYVLLKMIKKDIIQIFIGEESLSSYHFKTCMFYMIETTPAEFWTADNLLVCLHKCIAKMLTYVEKGECPNYFIPGENMFEGRIYGQTQAKLCEILRMLLSADFKYLLGINCDKLGIKYEKAILSGVTDSAVNLKQPFIYYIVGGLTAWRNLFLEISKTNLFKRLYWMKHLQRTQRITEHTVEQTHEVLSPPVPYVELSLMSGLVVKAKRSSGSNESIFNLLSSSKWRDVSLQSDSFSAKLKQAYLMTVLGYNKMSLYILIPLQDQVGEKISGCWCSEHSLDYENMYNEMAFAKTSSSEELLYRYWVPCVIFLPEERVLAPSALCYEMDRSVGSPPEGKEFWYDWAILDGKILLYFLLYLNHRQLGMEDPAAADADNIRRLIHTDRLLGHKETAWNLLGSIYKERGLVDQAVECFLESRTLKSTHNAASLHLQDIHGMQYQ